MVSKRSVEPVRLRRCPAFGQQWGLYRKGFFIQVGEYLLDDYRIFNAGDHFDAATTGTARLNVNIEHALEPLSPSHGCTTFGGCLGLRLIRCFGLAAFAPLCRRHLRTMFAIGREYTMKTGEIDSGLGHQSGQLGDEIQGSVVYTIWTRGWLRDRRADKIVGTGIQPRVVSLDCKPLLLQAS